MDRNEIIARLEAAIEALNAIGERAKIEVGRDDCILIGSWRGDNYACLHGREAAELVDGLNERHQLRAKEEEDRAAFESWRRERAAA